MRQVIQLAGLFLITFLFTGCISNDIEPSTDSTSPVPTAHPRLDDSNKSPTEDAEETPSVAPEAVSEHIRESISIISSEGNTIVAWATDNPSIGRVAYGRTDQYELGDAGNDLPSSQHAITLPNLETEVTYYYQITMIDTKTNTTSTVNGSFDTAREIPVIDIWYGLEQSFGQNGTPQRWINILGNVSDADGIGALTYSLNGGEELPLSIGSDDRRLLDPGDFNVDIFRTQLLSGENELVLRAVDTLDHQEIITMSINYTNDTVWPGMYDLEWSTVPTVQDAAEIVDGLWEIDEDGARTVIPGYQRLLAIGDIAWTDYEVIVPITVHDVYFAEEYGGAPGVGLLMRWTGHTDIFTPEGQPKSGWQPFGAIAWYRWDAPDSVYLRLEGTVDDVVDSPIASPSLEIAYIYKVRVETLANGESLYRFKVWEEGQTEPDTWNLDNEIQGTPNGSLLLLAHQVDASFGDITITQLAPPTSSPFLPNLSVLDDFSAMIPLTTTVPLTTTSPITESGSVLCTICTASLSVNDGANDNLLNKFNDFMMLLPRKTRLIVKLLT